jgi:hypothetical protein
MVRLAIKGHFYTRQSTLLFLVCCATLLFEIYIGLSHCLFSQLKAPVLHHPDLDISYWIIIASKTPDFLTSNLLITLTCDSLLFGLPIFILFKPKNKSLTWLLFLLLFLQHITISNFAVHHSHIFLGFIFIWIPFLFKKSDQTGLALEGVRFIMLFSYFSAFLWKLFRGNYFYLDQFSNIIKENMLPYMVENPNSIFSSFYHFLFEHPILTFTLGLIGIVLEGIFLIGFFSKKWDMALFYISIVIHFSFWIFADAFEFPLLILSLTLIPAKNLILKKA